MLGWWLRRGLRFRPPAEDIVLDVDEDVRLLMRASWQPGPREARPALVLVHGLAGDDGGGQVIAAALHAWSRGWHVLRMNMRGAGDSEAICARLYNSGLDGDVIAVLREASRHVPQIAAAGFSLGAALTLLAAGRRHRELPASVFGLAAVSPPLHLSTCADTFERPANRAYVMNFMGELKRAYRSRQRRLPHLYEAGRERGLRTIRAYDDAITAPYGGYRDAAHYYECSSAGPHLVSVNRPTLIVAAEDDPLIPATSITRWDLPASGCVQREMYPTGGHVGFVAPTPAPGQFWAAERLLDFLEAHSHSPLSR